MYAVIFNARKSAPTSDTIQTALIPTEQGLRAMHRVLPVGAMRADWREGTYAEGDALLFVLQGAPIALAITEADQRDIATLLKPTTLLQKAVRAVDKHGHRLVDFDANGQLTASSTPMPQLVTTLANSFQYRGASVFADFLPSALPVPTAKPVYLSPAPVAEPVVEVEVDPYAQLQALHNESARLINEAMAQVEEPAVEPAPVVAPEPAPAPVAVVQREVIESGSDESAVTLELESALEVPTTEEVGGYIERTIEGESETSVYAYAKRAKKAVLLTGDAGTGKTSSARHLAHQWGVPFAQFECTPATTISDVVGGFVPTSEKGIALWRHSELVTAIQQPSVVLINELSRMSPKSASYFLRLLQEREVYIPSLGRKVKVHPECLLIADMNVGYRGVSLQDEALLTRFRVKMEFEYDTTIEANFIPSPSLLEMATSLRDAYKRKEVGTPVSTRLLEDFVSQASNLNFAFAVKSFVNNFGDKDRPAVVDVLHTYAQGIATDLGVGLGSFVIPDIEVQTA